MTIRKIGAWNVARKILRSSRRQFNSAVNKTLLQEGLFYKKEIVQGIRKQAPAGKAFSKLAPLTRRQRKVTGFGGRKALIRSGDLIRSVTVIKRSRGVFVGVPRGAKGKDGRSMVDIAKLQEEGSRPIVIKVTPKMRRFLFGVLFRGRRGGKSRTGGGFAGGGSVIVIRIPARPFLRPVFDKFSKPSVAVPRVTKRMAKNLQFKFGR